MTDHLQKILDFSAENIEEFGGKSNYFRSNTGAN